MSEPASNASRLALVRVIAEDQNRQGTEIILLLLWAEQKRGSPNSFLRSSLSVTTEDWFESVLGNSDAGSKCYNPEIHYG
jgi:hypothetical protein